jgi:MATE family multidrug resistance protein
MRSIRGEIATIARLAAPIAVAQLGLITPGLVEVAILGRAAPEQLGGAAVGRSVGFLALSFCIGAAGALEPLAAQAVGAAEPRTAWSAFVATTRAGALLSVPCGAVAIASTWLLAPLGVAPGIVTAARAFVVAEAPGLALAATFLSAKAYLQAYKRTLPAIAAVIAANVANVVVCSALILGDDGLARAGLPRVGLPPLGALGAGLANTVANGVLAVGVLVPALRLRPTSGAAGADVGVARVLRLAAPIALQYLAEIGVFSVVAILAGRLGNVAVSAHQIAIGLASFTFMGALGISGATSVRVGHAVGEGRSARAPGVIGIVLGAAFMTCCALVFVSAPRALAFAFTMDHEIGALAERLLVIAAAFQLFDGVQGVAAGALRGVGDVRFPFVASVAAYWLVGFPLAIALGFVAGWGAPGLWWGLLVSLATIAILLAARFVFLTRKPIARV